MILENSCILGIDPGLEKMGFGVIVWEKGKWVARDYGICETKKKLSTAERLHALSEDVQSLLDLWKPAALAIEKLVFVQNVTSGMAVAEARGVVLAKAAGQKLLVVELLPNMVKSHITGNGHAPKSQVQKMLKVLLKLPAIPRPDDAADGLAIALTGAHFLRLELQQETPKIQQVHVNPIPPQS